MQSRVQTVIDVADARGNRLAKQPLGSELMVTAQSYHLQRFALWLGPELTLRHGVSNH